MQTGFRNCPAFGTALVPGQLLPTGLLSWLICGTLKPLQNDSSENPSIAAASVEPAEFSAQKSPPLRELKSRGQLLKPSVRVGKEGVTDAFLRTLDIELERHQLVKVKFDYFKEEKKQLAPSIAEKSRSQMVSRVGNVLVLFRAKASPAETNHIGGA